MPTSTITDPRPPAGRVPDAAVGSTVQPPCSSDRPGPAPEAARVPFRARRARRLGVSAVALTALLVPLGAACGSSDASTSSASTHAHAVDASAPSPTDDPHTMAVTLADYRFATDKSEVASGPVTFQVTNEGREAHQLLVGRLKAGATADSFLSTYRDQGEPAAFGLVEWAGGVNGIAPGASADGTSDWSPATT